MTPGVLASRIPSNRGRASLVRRCYTDCGGTQSKRPADWSSRWLSRALARGEISPSASLPRDLAYNATASGIIGCDDVAVCRGPLPHAPIGAISRTYGTDDRLVGCETAQSYGA